LNKGLAKEKPQVLDFAIFTMQNAQTIASETGFAPLTDEEIKAAVEELEALK
jgi:phosphate transport system substrate-binding protein